jgi:hypothetical protein
MDAVQPRRPFFPLCNWPERRIRNGALAGDPRLGPKALDQRDRGAVAFDAWFPGAIRLGKTLSSTASEQTVGHRKPASAALLASLGGRAAPVPSAASKIERRKVVANRAALRYADATSRCRDNIAIWRAELEKAFDLGEN